jgi:hypothetical protein
MSYGGNDMIFAGGRAYGAALPLSHQAVLAGLFMAADDTGSKGGAKSGWDSSGGGVLPPFLKPGDFDIYVNKITGETYIFHGPDLPYDVDRLEYDPADHSVTVVTKNALELDLGVKIQWLIRPYFTKAKTIYIVKTKDGEAIDGIEVPLVVKA